MRVKIIVDLFPIWKQAELKAGRDITIEEVKEGTRTTRPFVARMKEGGEFDQFHLNKVTRIVNYLSETSGLEFEDGETVPFFKFKRDSPHTA